MPLRRKRAREGGADDGRRAKRPTTQEVVDALSKAAAAGGMVQVRFRPPASTVAAGLLHTPGHLWHRSSLRCTLTCAIAVDV